MDPQNLIEERTKQLYAAMGKWFIVLGAILISFGLLYIFFVPIVRNCAATGCPPLTLAEIFDFYWAAFAVIAIGITLILIGYASIHESRSISTTTTICGKKKTQE